MGTLCDPAHPAQRDFPANFYLDWQSWDPALRSRNGLLDRTAAKPIVRIIDNFTRNHSLAKVLKRAWAMDA